MRVAYVEKVNRVLRKKCLNTFVRKQSVFLTAVKHVQACKTDDIIREENQSMS